MTDLEIRALAKLFAQLPEFREEIDVSRFNELLERGLVQLWVHPDALEPVAALVTELQHTPFGKRVNVLGFAGTNVDENRQMWSSIKNWARKNGCGKIRAECEGDARTRLFARDGFRKIRNVIELELSDEN